MAIHEYLKEISTSPMGNITLTNVGTGTGTIIQTPGTNTSFNVKSIGSSNDSISVTNGGSAIDITLNPGDTYFANPDIVANLDIATPSTRVDNSPVFGLSYSMTNAGTYLINWCASVSVGTPANVAGMYINIRKWLSRLLRDNWWYQGRTFGTEELLTASITDTALAGATYSTEIGLETNWGGGSTFTLNGVAGQATVTFSITRLY